ncbi:MAG TPA: DUF962 domain-containing protein [Candidatus Xenobia bacterium]|jgi:hypothetical protein
MRSDNGSFEDFEAFWPFYLGQHSQPATRWIHFGGTTAVLAAAAYALARHDARMVKWLPLIGYGPAWFAHFFVEQNRPATFKYPLWSLRGDFRMWYRMLTGRL